MESLFQSAWIDHPNFSCNDSKLFCHWISDRASLTEKVKQLCKGRFSVTVLRHNYVETPDYASLDLDSPPGSLILHREVLLCDDTEPLVFACSLLPKAALTGRFQEIRDLGARPLGHWIFSEPVLHRKSLTFAEIPGHASLFNRIPRSNAVPELHIPGRKTLFAGASHPFLVSEFFLPELQSRIG